ncbi:high affinity copper uptake protein 1-like [Corticium candelabrum]|uniref:high affinity copper uptake protein 1-like n=1 Tax=Corticium candelabrum TaxID=121492 RepID=UPI002E25F9CB|nr:high affinity copper uptake protein 1-like [Corticium candelabrum]
MQSMVFHFGADAKILFVGWNITSTGGMVGSCVAVIALSLLYELSKTFKELLLRRHLQSGAGRYSLSRPTNYSSNDAEAGTISERSQLFSKWNKKQATLSWLAHLLQTLLYFINITLGYSLMMVFMTLNVWLCLSLLFGLTLGYLVFAKGRQSSESNTEDCH